MIELKRSYIWDTINDNDGIILCRGEKKIELSLSDIYMLEYDLWTWLDSRCLGMVYAFYGEDGVSYRVHKDNENSDCGISRISKFLFPVLGATGLYKFSSRIARKIWGLRPCKRRISFFGIQDDGGKECKRFQQRRRAKK